MRQILLPPVMLDLCLMAIAGTHYFLKDNYILFQGSFKFIGYGLMLIGISLPIWGARLFRHYRTNIIPYKNPDHMVTSGPFQFSRNPMYLGMFILLIGVAISYGNIMGFIFPIIYFSVAHFWYIPFEEEKMLDAFGDEFLTYKTKVRRWL